MYGSIVPLQHAAGRVDEVDVQHLRHRCVAGARGDALRAPSSDVAVRRDLVARLELEDDRARAPGRLAAVVAGPLAGERARGPTSRASTGTGGAGLLDEQARAEGRRQKTERRESNAGTIMDPPPWMLSRILPGSRPGSRPLRPTRPGRLRRRRRPSPEPAVAEEGARARRSSTRRAAGGRLGRRVAQRDVAREEERAAVGRGEEPAHARGRSPPASPGSSRSRADEE